MKLKVYKMNDCDWVLSALPKEETNEWYKKQFDYSDEEQLVEDVLESSLDEGYWEECDLLDIIGELESAEDKEFKVKTDNGYWIWVSFEESIEQILRENSYDGPFILCSTEH